MLQQCKQRIIPSSKQLPACVFTDKEYSILPRNANKSHLHEAVENKRFEDVSRLIGSERETYLVECFEGEEKFYKSILHLIAAIHDTEQATELCRQLLQRISNRKNREYLLNMTTVDEFDVLGKKVHARVAAIHIAAYNGNSGVVRLLCQEYGVDANCSTSETLEEKPKKGITALEWAARRGHREVVKVLIDNKVHVNVRRPTDGSTPLYIAAQEGHTEVVKLLLINNANVNASRHTYGFTPLHVAALGGHTEVVKLLLINNADVNASTHTDGSTPLCDAALGGHTEVVKLLLINNADVNASCTDDGSTPLYVAAQEGHTEVVKLLLCNNANVNARSTDDGATPLYAAAWCGHREVVKLLLEKNANVNAERSSGDKPIDAARKNQHSDIVQLLAKKSGRR